MSVTRMMGLALGLSLAAAPAAFAQVPVARPGTAVQPGARGPAFQPGNRPVSAAPGAQGGGYDALFAMAAADGGLAELGLSELGRQKATDPELKRFSEKMVQEHTRMNAELTALAAQKRMQLPRTPDHRAQFCAQSLAGLSGAEFDKCYAKAQLVAHMDALSAFEAEAERGQDPDVKALAAKGVSHIKEHLREIRPMAMKHDKDMHHDGDHSKSAHPHTEKSEK